MHLFIMNYDSLTGLPGTEILLNGPTLVVTGDGVNPTEVKYVLDPPFALPAPGKYSFAIKESFGEGSFACAGIFHALFDTLNPYAEGISGRSDAYYDCSKPWAPEAFPDRYDMIFRIGFCTSDTPALRNTWGRLKEHYR